jgi:tetraacyldisaccharide 4'-kinase
MRKQASDFIVAGWYSQLPRYRWWLFLLHPVSWLFRVLSASRRYVLERRRIGKPVLAVPVVIVGNLAVGGTGKSPLLCSLALTLTARGVRVGIISRGYGGEHKGSPVEVKPGDAASRVGDEPLMLARRTHCPVVVSRDRVAAAAHLAALHPVDVILSDDGLQHYALPRVMEIAVIDGARGLGNGMCLPAGPLREPPARLREVDAVVCNGTAARIYRADQHTMTIEPVCWRDIHTGEEQPLAFFAAGSTVHAVAGIGHPERFFETLKLMGYTVLPHPFPDHHAFHADELAFGDGLPVVMTEKDSVKCSAFGCGHRYALVVSAILPEQLVDQVMTKLGR